MAWRKNEVTFRFRLIPICGWDARHIIDENILCLMSFVSLMCHGRELAQKADELLYESSFEKIS